MSGSSGGGGGGTITDDEIACSTLKFEAQIASPNPAVVSTLSVGNELSILIATLTGTQEIQVVTATGQLVGGLLANRVQRLRECILQANNYKARVISINSGQVRVFVERI